MRGSDAIKRFAHALALMRRIFFGGNRPWLLLKMKLSPLFMFRGVVPDFPRTLNIHVTFRCNLRCRGCASHGKQGHFVNADFRQLEQAELTTEEFKKIIAEAASSVPLMVFSGGEPLLRDDMPALVEYAKQQKVFTIMVTNGTLLREEVARRLVRCGLDRIVFSLDGTREIHENLRGLNGIFDTIMQNLHMLCRIKQEESSAAPFIQVNYVLFEENYREMAQFAETIDADPQARIDLLTFSHPLFIEKETAEAHYSYMKDKYSLSSLIRDQIIPNIRIVPEELTREIARVRQQQHRWKFRVVFRPDLHGSEAYYYSPGYVSSARSCGRLFSDVTLLPDGNVIWCADAQLGNIRQQTLRELWHGERASFFRKALGRSLWPCCKRCCWLR